MVSPNILFPVFCHIQPLSREETHYDEDLREPIQSEVYGSTIILPGQVMWTNQSKLSPSPYGATEQSDGYIVFKYTDLRRKRLEIKREDRIIKIGFLEVDLYVVGLQPIAHYADQRGPGLLKALFRDRQNTRNSPGV